MEDSSDFPIIANRIIRGALSIALHLDPCHIRRAKLPPRSRNRPDRHRTECPPPAGGFVVIDAEQTSKPLRGLDSDHIVAELRLSSREAAADLIEAQADEIERRRADHARMHAALRQIAGFGDGHGTAVSTARRALAGLSGR